jgi:acyl-CoA thioester hydrolase
MSSLGGRVDGDTHVLPLRVYYEDTDAAGIVYYANYLRFTERARTDMLRLMGISQRELHGRLGLSFAVRHCEIDYLTPARLDDEIEVHTTLLEIGGASLRARQVVKRGGDDLACSTVRVGCIGSNGRPHRMPVEVRGALQAMRASKGRG